MVPPPDRSRIPSVPVLRERGELDGFPVAAATPERVTAYLQSVPVAVAAPELPIPPAHAVPLLADVAACCLMAGCPPVAMPIVLAALRAVCAPGFNLLAIQTTTSGVAPCIVVSGPAVTAAGLHAGVDAMSSNAPANAAVGRALRLVLRIVGGAVPGTTDLATLGHPGKVSWCLAEHLSANPWPPAVEPGDGPDASVVTAFAAGGSLEVVLDGNDIDELVELLSHACLAARFGGSAHRWGRGAVLVVLPPEIAHRLHAAGLDRDGVATTLFERATASPELLSPPLRDALRAARRERGEDLASPVRVARSADDFVVVVSGGVGIKAAVIAGWSPISEPQRAVV